MNTPLTGRAIARASAAFLAVALLLASFVAGATPAAAQTYQSATNPDGSEMVLCKQGGAWKACSLALIKAYTGSAGGTGLAGGNVGDVQVNSGGVLGATDNFKLTGASGDTASGLPTYGPNVSATDPDVLNTHNETVAASIAASTDAANTAPTFADAGTVSVTLNAHDGGSVFGNGINGSSVPITQNKTTFFTGNFVLNSTASGQNNGLATFTHAEGMGDAASFDMQTYFGGANTPGGECDCLFPFAHLQQDDFVPGYGSALTALTAYACDAVLTQVVHRSEAPQTVTVSGTCPGPWAIADLASPNFNMNEAAVYITGTGSGTVTGIFRVDLPMATFTGAQSGTTLTVTALTAGETLVPGQSVQGAGVPSGEVIVAYGPDNFGGAGTYVVSASATVSSEAMTSAGVLSTAYKAQETACNGYCGQDRVWIDVSRAGYAAGQAGVLTDGKSVTGSSGASWSTTSAGGVPLRPGCIQLTADQNNGGGTFNGTSVDYYEVQQVTSSTTLDIYRLDTAGNQSYHGLGTTAGDYSWYPCGRSVLVGPTTAALGSLLSNEFILDVAPGFTVGDTIIQPNSPYPDVSGGTIDVALYSPGATARSSGLLVLNTGSVEFDSSFEINGGAFHPSAGFPMAHHKGFFCEVAAEVCFYSQGDLAFGSAQLAGQSGYGLSLSNTSGTGTQGGVILFGFKGPDLTLADQATGSGFDCLHIGTSGAIADTSGDCFVGVSAGSNIAVSTTAGTATVSVSSTPAFATIGGKNAISSIAGGSRR
jgi:hypothetical protein